MAIKEHTLEALVGALVLAVAVSFFAFAFLQVRQGEASGRSNEFWGAFQRVDGVSVGSDVRVSGVKVGVVREVTLDPETFEARVTMALDPSVALLDDTLAAVRSDGLLGGAYISLEPAGFEPLPSGSQILRTQGSTDLLTLMFSAMSTLGSGSQEALGEAPAP